MTQRYKQLIEKVNQGQREYLYRSRDQMAEDKALKGGSTNATWFLKGEIKQVQNKPVTPG